MSLGSFLRTPVTLWVRNARIVREILAWGDIRDVLGSLSYIASYTATRLPGLIFVKPGQPRRRLDTAGETELTPRFVQSNGGGVRQI